MVSQQKSSPALGLNAGFGAWEDFGRPGMRDRDGEWKPGERIRLTVLGKKRCPRLKIHTGVVVGRTHRSDAVRILLDGRKMPITLHSSYVESD